MPLIDLKKYSDCFVETGTLFGEGIDAALLAGYSKIFSIELCKTYYERAVEKYRGDNRVTPIRGDSSICLFSMIREIDEPITFWLDGHFISMDPIEQEEISHKTTDVYPIIEELYQIEKHHRKDHTILIDDMHALRNYNEKINEELLKKYILDINPSYMITFIDGHNKDDILFATTNPEIYHNILNSKGPIRNITYASQHGQDMWVLERLNWKRKGFFLDTGAWEPIHLSNTYSLEKEYGWNGICVEPLKSCYERLLQNRTCKMLNTLLDYKEGEANFLNVRDDGLSGIIDYMCDFDLNRLRNHDLFKDNPLESFCIKMPTRTLSSILEECNAPPVIDYWSLDLEGGEPMALKTFPWDKHTVSLLTIEHNTGEPHRTFCRDFLRDKGYKVLPNYFCIYEDHFSKL